MAGDAWAEIGGIWLVRLVPGDPLTSPGMDLLSKIRAPAPVQPQGGTRPASAGTAAGDGMGGRGLSHPQEEPLAIAGAGELRARPGPAGSRGHERLIGWRCP